jgi:hypothetical protein
LVTAIGKGKLFQQMGLLIAKILCIQAICHVEAQGILVISTLEEIENGNNGTRH